MEYLEAGFSADGYRVMALLKRIATSNAFFAVALPEPVGQSVAAVANGATER
jgi:hypothetical protein